MTTENNAHGDKGNIGDSDRRIDEMARTAGQQLRRPAPAHGLDTVQMTTRRRRAVRAAGAGTAVAVLVAVGAFALTRGDDEQRIVPVNTTIGPTPTTTATTGGGVTSLPPDGAGVPEVIYAASGFTGDPGYLQHVIDPSTGEEVRTETPDGEASMAAQEALTAEFVYRGEYLTGTLAFGYRFEAGDIGYSYLMRGSDSPDLSNEDPAILALFDRCEQSELTVVGAELGQLPARVQRLAMSRDRRWLATASTECPVEGTLVGQEQVVLATTRVRVFDAAHPDRPGLQLMTTSQRIEFSSLFFSPDGNYLAVQTEGGYRVFDVADGSEVQFAPGECGVGGGRYSRFAGPWVGQSSMVLVLDCPTRGVSMLVVDVVTGNSLEVQLPDAGNVPTTDGGLSPYLIVEVDSKHYTTPANAWYTLCELAVQRHCWYGQGSAASVLIPDAQEASFLPLGFTYGG